MQYVFQAESTVLAAIEFSHRLLVNTRSNEADETHTIRSAVGIKSQRSSNYVSSAKTKK